MNPGQPDLNAHRAGQHSHRGEPPFSVEGDQCLATREGSVVRQRTVSGKLKKIRNDYGAEWDNRIKGSITKQ